MEEITPDISALVRKLSNDTLEQKEAALLQFFGSYENAVEKAQDYVIEEYPMEVTTTPWALDPLEQTTFRVISKWRIRRKTDEEKAQERTDDILAKNAPIGKCIVCEKDIYQNDEGWIRTPHGLYHTECVQGKPDNYRRQWPEDY